MFKLDLILFSLKDLIDLTVILRDAFLEKLRINLLFLFLASLRLGFTFLLDDLNVLKAFEEIIDIIKCKDFPEWVVDVNVDTVIFNFFDFIRINDWAILNHDFKSESCWIIFFRNEIFKYSKVNSTKKIKSLSIIKFCVSDVLALLKMTWISLL